MNTTCSLVLWFKLRERMQPASDLSGRCRKDGRWEW